MAKKKSKNSVKIELSLVLRIVALVLGVAAVCFGFLQSVSYTGKLLGTETSLTGFEVMFGKEDLGGLSFMTLVAFLLPLAGGVLMVFKNKLLNIIALVCFVVGAVLLFLVPNFVVLVENSLLGAYTSKLAVGSILSAVASILGAGVAGYVTFLAK